MVQAQQAKIARRFERKMSETGFFPTKTHPIKTLVAKLA
jgi:hypothetical protein